MLPPLCIQLALGSVFNKQVKQELGPLLALLDGEALLYLLCLTQNLCLLDLLEAN